MAKGFLDGYKTYDTGNGHGNARRWQEAFRDRMTKDEAKTLLAGINLGPYDILEITTSATKTEIKKAFRQQLMKWHPDRNPENVAEAQERTRWIIAAYTELTEN